MIGTILTFLLVLSVLVLVHEFGHFVMARRAGVWVEEFGFGLPPRIWGKKVGETLYSLNLLPFGGFVRLHGENDNEGIADPQRAFLNKSKKARVKIVIAGVVMNFLLAVVAFSTVYSFAGVPRKTQDVSVVSVMDGTPAKEAGIPEGSVVKSVNGEAITSVEAFIHKVDENKGRPTAISVSENGIMKEYLLTPRENPPENQGPIGVAISSEETYFPPIYLRPLYGIYYGFGEAVFWGGTIIVGVFKLFTDLFSGHGAADVAGPVGIYAMTTEVSKIGVLALVNFVGILSVNLAILNVLPFPALDGGRLLFIFIEKLVGRKVVPKVEAAIHTAGMVILLLLVFAITYYDIKRLIMAGSISGFLDLVTK